MNPGVFSVKYNRVVFVAMAIAVIGGYMAYQRLGRLEDPEFTIKQALIITPYPGASAEEVAKEVTNPVERAVQQLGQLDRVESESSRGMSVVTARILDRYHKDAIPQVWDELRRKINDVQPQLPPSVRGRSMVVDNFGDVFGIFLAISGDGFSLPELRRYAEFLRRELLLVEDVKSVELFAAQEEVVYLEISRQRLAQLGINEEQIYAKLQERNIAADGGRVRVGDQHIALDPHGAFNSAYDMLDLVIGSDRTGRQLFLKDVATLERGDQDPPRRLLRYDGKPAIGIGISTMQGGNVVTMGDGVRRKLDELDQYRPVGIELGEINFQPKAVSSAVTEFMWNLGKAVSIVFIVLVLAMGFRTGLIIGAVLFLTIMATFLVMFVKGDLLMERVSLGALIIALCMLTDNAIIVIEGCKVGIERGENKLEVVREAVAQNQWPLFGATAIGVLAFAAIGLSQDASGEVANSLFWVILISLTLSWISSVTVTPLLSYLMFKPNKQAEAQAKPDPYSGFFFRNYRRLLVTALRFRWATVLISIVAFVAGLYGFTRVKQSFFPNPDRPQFMVDVFLPAGTHIRETEAFAGEVQRYIQSQPRVTHVTSFIGGGGLRFLLTYSPEGENRAFVQLLVDVDDWRKIGGLIPDVQKHLDEQYPNANAVAKKFLLGPGDGGRIQARFQGPDPAKLRELGDQAIRVLEDDGRAVCVRGDWREPVKVIRPDLLDLQARRNGITRVEVAQAFRPASKVAWSVSTASRAAPPRASSPGNAALADCRPSAADRARGRQRHQQLADLEPGRRADDPHEPSCFRRRGRVGRSDHHASQSLTDSHGSRRPTNRTAQRVVRARAIEDRADRVAAGLFAGMGRRERGFHPCPRLPGQAAPVRLGDHGVHLRVPVQFDSGHAPDVADHAAVDRRRDGGPADDRHAIHIHGPARRSQPGGRANQNADRRPEQEPRRDREGKAPYRRSSTDAPARCGRCAWS